MFRELNNHFNNKLRRTFKQHIHTYPSMLVVVCFFVYGQTTTNIYRKQVELYAKEFFFRENDEKYLR